MKAKLLFLSVLWISLISFSQNTYVPDDNFEQALIDLGIDSDRTINDTIATADISGIENLDVHWKQIRDLTGIEGFSNLKVLRCSSNQLISLDLSQNDSLREVNCRGNDLTSIDVSKCKKLKSLNCEYNELQYLDVSENSELEVLVCGIGNKIGYYGKLDVSKNLNLKTLFCNSILLNELDVSKNTKLESLYCNNNYINSLEVNANTSLEYLSCSSNQITELILLENKLLNTLYCSNNQLEELDLSENDKLVDITCDSNQIRSLDVSHIFGLGRLWCSGNDLTSLNVRNRNNSIIYAFYAEANPSLFCIQVDDAENANAGLYPYQNWKKDDRATYSEDCAQPVTISVNDVFEQLLVDLHIDSDGEVNGEVSTSDIYGLLELEVPSGYSISNLDGIENLISLESLIVSDIGLTSLDVSNNPTLKQIDCSNNQLTSLDLNNNLGLNQLDCSNNQISSLDLSNNLMLTYIDVSNNPITPGSLILPANSLYGKNASDALKIENSKLKTYLSNDNLLYLNVANTNLTSIDVSYFVSLDSLDVQGSQLDSLDVSNNANLSYLNTTNTSLTCVQVSQDQLNNIPTAWVKDATTTYSVDCNAMSDEDFNNSTFSMYPNPFSEELIIDFIEEARYSIINLNGQTLRQGNLTKGESTLDLSTISSGLYFIKLKTEKGNITKKVIKK
jgi:Leucine-rich repeat (LRR) protein